MVGRKHCRMTERQHVLENRFVRLGSEGSLPTRFEPAAQHLPLPLRPVEALANEIALTTALLQLGVQPATTRQASDQIPHEASDPAHLKAIIAPPMTIPREGRVATLWNLMFDGSSLSCAVYQGPTGMELRLESATGTIFREPFDMQPRSLARTKALRESLKRRGWEETNPKSQILNPESQ
jgi:hypothetical protein